MRNLAKKYAKHDTRPGFVPEQDGHFTVSYLPLIEGWTAHVVKEPPKLDKSQWVEVIHRNGERDRGPVECFAWRLFKCHPNLREDYQLRKTIRCDHKPGFEHIDMEITHYRTISTPPNWWLQGMDWPFAEVEASEQESAA